MSTIETAYAKINLALHVRRRREDGYHELETLFAFVDAGDVLSAAPAAQDSLHVVGEFSGLLGSNLPSPRGRAGDGGSALSSAEPPPPAPPQGEGSVLDNLVARALNALPRPQGLAVTLEKNLPVAAGLGGGSADAGAVFRMVEALHGLPEDWQARAAKLGADVPACVLSRTHIGLGTGTEHLEVEDDLAGTPVLLVNPRVPLSTGPVFKAWDGEDRGALPQGPASKIAREGRNDLENPAISLCPVIADVLAALAETKPWLARMSGSGATCFALYDTAEARDVAAAAMPSGWWTMAGRLR
ncbi:4-(cytidine 5'-diphospho)-2-C-methyl-D-erythritol kinase [Porphyrobacter sp. TH134]|uniref:4-(cytidine 5'-diphospho)-2-C-methyl-D-erythritol kinase n=1 Tax=Porphyrobacter sp. TH134 TaxID=2067450 RepID=UPI000C7E284F|nr:4-(cytidine 5'-diphospho)-2-C-methyl-D-erythritol kinase [Porphyrobacter sp. TH134]PLK25005.1 4-(cytidine 5'-diphospho)-2-C-methyl-D-erythritol kinase [Porphyrobacter sp. TH134]